jgi:demethylmenaquinone methyltransferase/2-methoxy-6-polyprenyl-1,4-benzoquinol methylase
LRVFQSRAQTRAFYNRIARFYDLFAERSEKPLREVALTMLHPRSGQNVLEIGFGRGHVLASLARTVGPKGKVFGIDISEEMLRLAGTLLKAKGLADPVELRCGDAAKLPYADARMDAVFISFALELFDTPDIPVVLAECRRVLRPGGRIVVLSLSRTNPRGLATRIFDWTHQHFPGLLDCRAIHVRQAVEDAGFRIAYASLQQMWIPVEIVLGIR